MGVLRQPKWSTKNDEGPKTNQNNRRNEIGVLKYIHRSTLSEKSDRGPKTRQISRHKMMVVLRQFKLDGKK